MATEEQQAEILAQLKTDFPDLDLTDEETLQDVRALIEETVKE